MRPMKRFAAALMALAVICSAALLPQPAAALVTQADIDALKGDAKDLTAQRKALEEKLAALSDDKAEVMKKKELLDDQIAVQVSEIRNVESQISTYEDLIAQTQAELADAQQKEEIQYDLFCKRVRAMEEEGTVSYWSVLFKADSFTDLLDRLDAVNEVMDADQAVIDRLEALQDEISQKEAELQESKAGAEAARADLVSKKSALEKQRAEANQLIAQLASPGGIGSTNHKGTDIGRVGYTSPIYAAKAGTVIVSQRSSSYGNYVVISHGSGNTTLYGHMSSRKVEVGQYVNQGDVIGITGSTGNSTGPHLHFEITENGVRVNPLSDGAQPQMGYLSGYTLGR